MIKFMFLADLDSSVLPYPLKLVKTFLHGIFNAFVIPFQADVFAYDPGRKVMFH